MHFADPDHYLATLPQRAAENDCRQIFAVQAMKHVEPDGVNVLCCDSDAELE